MLSETHDPIQSGEMPDCPMRRRQKAKSNPKRNSIRASQHQWRTNNHFRKPTHRVRKGVVQNLFCGIPYDWWMQQLLQLGRDGDLILFGCTKTL